MGAIASQITSLTIVYSAVYSDADQRKHQSSASLAFVRGIHRGPVNSPHKWPVTQEMFPFDYAIMEYDNTLQWRNNEHDGVWNHRHLDFTQAFAQAQIKKTLKLRVTGLCEGIHRWPVNSPHKGSLMRKMFQFDDVIIFLWLHDADDKINATNRGKFIGNHRIIYFL